MVQSYIIVCFLSATFASSLEHFEHNLFPIGARNPPSKILINLERVLDHVYALPRYYLSTFSIVSSESKPDYLKAISRYAANKMIKCYQLRGLSSLRSCAWKNETDLTWILLLEDPNALDGLLKRQNDLWRPPNRYVILLTAEERIVSWRRVFRLLWNLHKVHQVIAIPIQDRFECVIKYSPFAKEREEYGAVRKRCLAANESVTSRAKGVSRAERVYKANCDSGAKYVSKAKHASGLSKATSEIWDEDDFDDLNGYPITVTVFQSLMMNITYRHGRARYTRPDARVMRLLEKYTNASFVVNVLHRSEHADPFSEALARLANGHSELVLTGFLTKSYEPRGGHEFTAAIHEDKLCLVAPAASLVPRPYLPLLPFPSQVWLLLATCKATVTTLWVLVKYFSRSFVDGKPALLPLARKPAGSIETRFDVHGARRSVQSPASRSRRLFGATCTAKERNLLCGNGESNNEKVVRVQLNESARRSRGSSRQPVEIDARLSALVDLAILCCQPLKGADTGAQRVFLSGTLFVGIIVCGLYESGLVSILSEPAHYPELNTMEDVARSNLTVVTKYANLRDTLPEDTPLGAALKRRVVVVETSVPTYDLVAYRNAISIGRQSAFYLEDHSGYQDEYGRELLHVVEECPGTYIMAYVAKRQSPFLERINAGLLRTREAGLVQLWLANLAYTVKARAQSKVVKRDKRVRLTVEHFYVGFAGLAAGLLGSSIVFVGELYFARKFAVAARETQRAGRTKCADVSRNVSRRKITSLL